MTALEEFLPPLLNEGRVVFRRRPEPTGKAAPEALALLDRAYSLHALDVAGPAPAFEPAVAVAAAELVRGACLALVSHEAPAADLERALTMPRAPSSPSDHLSADLLLRFLPQVHKRARALNPGDVLVALLERVLRQWPLSGVLADLDDGPASTPDFGAHEGLMLLYAERLARHEKPAWRPDGRAFEYVELVLRDLGRARSPLLTEPARAVVGADHDDE